MRTRSFSAVLLTSSIFLSAAAAASAAPSIQLVIPTFDFPAPAYFDTVTSAISNNGTVVGTVQRKYRVANVMLFERFADGTFSTPVEFPGSLTTIPNAVNDSNLVCGVFIDTLNTVHGFFYDGTTFTQYDAPGSTGTILTGLNDAGDFCGYADSGGRAFVSIGGTLVDFTIPSAAVVFPEAVNNLGQVAGSYQDGNGDHGFFRDTDGTLTYSLDYPQAFATGIHGLNDKGFMVGTWLGLDGTAHGLALKLAAQYLSFDYGGSENGPNLSSINNSGFITGSYAAQSDHQAHGFIAKLAK